MIQPESFNPIRFSQYARDLEKALLMPTIGEQLKAARAELASARGEVVAAAADSADTAKAVLVEVKKLKDETADMRAELAGITNGGPPIEDTPAVMPPASFP